MSQSIVVYLLILLQYLFLLPLKDRRSSRRGFPWMTMIIVLVNLVIHILLTLNVFFPDWPNYHTWETLYPYMEVPRHIIDGEGLGVLSVVTSTYLHADVGHILGNMFVLWFFGRKVEDATGAIRFGMLYTLCGFTSAVLSVLMGVITSGGYIPSLGASGAIAGIMGAYLFLYSGEKILTLIGAFIPLRDCTLPLIFPLWLPAWAFIIYSFLHDALWGQLVIDVMNAGRYLHLGVGVFAHIGGAFGGMLFITLFLHPEVLAQQR